MKIWVILCLAAGPLVVQAQRADGWISGQRADGLVPGQRADNLHRIDGLFSPWRPPAVTLPMSLYVRNSIRILLPDRMPCLVPRRLNDPMTIDRRRNADKMPNPVGIK